MAVPRNPVAPVTAMRLPARASAITRSCLPCGKCRPRRHRPAGTSDRILDAALAQFGRRGYEATSLDALAAELGLTKQAILYWFPSKEALLDAVVVRSADDLRVALEARAGGHAARASGGWRR